MKAQIEIGTHEEGKIFSYVRSELILVNVIFIQILFLMDLQLFLCAQKCRS